MSRQPPYRTDRGRGGRNIPPSCWRCWWQERGNCFNPEMGEVPKTHISPITGEETETEWNAGWEITDEHWWACRDHLKHKQMNQKIAGARGHDRRFLLLEESV